MYLLEDIIIRKDFTQIKQTVAQYELFEDWPWPLIYKELDQMFPGSKFILTVRSSEEKWLESLKKHSMKTHPTNHRRKLVYGYNYPHKNEDKYIDFYRHHNESVRSYFKNRSDDFIELCWENGDGFEELCSFLNCKVPDVSFPHANKGTKNVVSKKRLWTNKFLSIINQ